MAHTILSPDGRIEPHDGPLPATCRMKIPCRWGEGGLGEFAGRVRLRRRFQWPKPLGSFERLWLVFAGADYYCTVWLNGEYLGRHEGAFDPFEFEVTSIVRERNELAVEVDLPAEDPGKPPRRWMLRGSSVCTPTSGGLWGPVALEVRREAFLRDVRLWSAFDGATPALHVAGETVGERTGALELYVLLDDSTVIYHPVQVTPHGAGFYLSASVPQAEPWWPAGMGRARLHEVGVELVEGASKLDVKSRLLGFHRHSFSDSVRRPGGESFAAGATSLSNNLEYALADIVEPVVVAESCERASREGSVFWLNLPVERELAAESHREAETLRQVRAIVTHLQHYPCIIGWTWHALAHPSGTMWNPQLELAIRTLDPSRPSGTAD